MDMKTEQLEIFIKVAQCGSMQKASDFLFTSRQNISRSISSLEEEFDVKLFDRLPGKLVLTESGGLLYSFALKYMYELNSMKNTLTAYKHNDKVVEKEKLSLLAISGDIRLLSNILSEFLIQHPFIELHVEEAAYWDIEQNLKEASKYDILISNIQVDETKNLIDYERFELCIKKMGVIARKDSIVAELGKINLEQLALLPVIGYVSSGETIPNIERILLRSDFELNCVLKTNNIYLIVTHIINRSAYLLATKMDFERMLQISSDLKFMDLNDNIYLQTALYVRRTCSTACKRLVKNILEYFNIMNVE